MLVFAGAGVSAELSVPAMRAMAEAFRDHLRDNGYSSSVVERIERLLESGDYDMEGLIDDLDSTSRGAEAEARWGLTGSPDLGELQGLRAEAEWLVSHLCERVDARRAARLWGPALRMGQASLTVATTNYDRAIELAAQQTGALLADGFPPFSGAELVEWVGFEESSAIRLLKSHGSTDWYQDEERRRTWKLRHAMPVFGAIRVTVEAEQAVKLGSALVLPSREKVVTYPPYPDIAYEFRKAADSADFAVFIGTSLRDPDLLGLATRCAARIPTIVVAHADRSYPGRFVQMSASRFLVAVLPRIARAPDAASAVALAQEESGRLDPILDDVVTAMDAQSNDAERCKAIDSLAACRTAFERQEIEALLRDGSEEIRTYALGLIRDSPDREELAILVSELASAAPDTAFAREAQVLGQLS